MSKYDWSGVPKEVNWIATDSDSVANGFYAEPKKGDHDMWFDDNNDGDWIELGVNYVGMFKGDWRDSLEKRPGEENAI